MSGTKVFDSETGDGASPRQEKAVIRERPGIDEAIVSKMGRGRCYAIVEGNAIVKRPCGGDGRNTY